MKRVVDLILGASIVFAPVSVFSQETTRAIENIKKERELIEMQKRELELEYKMRMEFLDDALDSAERRERVLGGSCPHPPCDEEEVNL